jgi:hypothetical protein
LGIRATPGFMLFGGVWYPFGTLKAVPRA